VDFNENDEPLPGQLGNGSKIREKPRPEPKVTVVTDRERENGQQILLGFEKPEAEDIV
jgi:hypothetical protein